MPLAAMACFPRLPSWLSRHSLSKRGFMSLKPQRGFSLLETMVALAVLLGVGGIVMSGMVQMMRVQNTIGNRTEMHTSVRSATELLQQEIGQAGKVSLGPPNVNVTKIGRAHV